MCTILMHFCQVFFLTIVRVFRVLKFFFEPMKVAINLHMSA